jgi:hypothetical protein
LLFRAVLSFGLSDQNLVHVSLLSHACHMPSPPHSPWLELWHRSHQCCVIGSVQRTWYWHIICININRK